MTSPQPGYRPAAPQPPPPPGRPPLDPWTRSSTDRIIAGVCGGLGRRLGIDPVILRVVVVVLAFFAGAGILLYAAAWLFMPLDRTNQSVVSDALGADSPDRGRSILTAIALVVVISIASLIAFDGGFVPGLLIALIVVALLLVVRRDDHAAPPGQPAYVPPGTYPAYGAPGSGQPQYGVPGYEAPTSPLASTTPSPYPSTSAVTDPTVVTDPSAEPTDVLGVPATGTEPTNVWPQMPSSSEIPPPSGGPSWQPPYYGPPTQSYLADQPPPAPPRRERSYLGVLTVSAMIAVVGVMGIIDLSGVAVPVAGYLVAALGVVAAGLILGAWMGRSRGLIALGVVLGIAIGPAILVDAVAGTEWRDWSNADNIRVAPQTPDELAEVYDYGGGSFRLDLTDLDFEDEDLATTIDMGAGEIIVLVPSDVDVAVNASVVAGDVVIFDRRSSGFDAGDTFTDLGDDGVGGGRLELSIDLGLGKVEVRRATS